MYNVLTRTVHIADKSTAKASAGCLETNWVQLINMHEKSINQYMHEWNQHNLDIMHSHQCDHVKFKWAHFPKNGRLTLILVTVNRTGESRGGDKKTDKVAA